MFLDPCNKNHDTRSENLNILHFFFLVIITITPPPIKIYIKLNKRGTEYYKINIMFLKSCCIVWVFTILITIAKEGSPR